MSVPEILDELIEIKLGSKNRRRGQRRLSYLFESLALQGDAAVPLIREFLNKMEDVDFAVQREGESDEERNQRYSRFRATLNFSQPPTLRIGLIDMLAEIGGDQAEATIGELLSTTGRGVEIAYAGKIIQSWLGKDALPHRGSCRRARVVARPGRGRWRKPVRSLIQELPLHGA